MSGMVFYSTPPADLAHQLRVAHQSGGQLADLLTARHLDAQYGSTTDRMPDFVRLFPVVPCTAPIADQLKADFVCACTCCRDRLTPRQAFWLYQAALGFRALLTAAVSNPRAVSLTMFPRAAQQCLRQPTWVAQMVHTIHLLAARLAAGQAPVPRSTAEELAVMLTIMAGDYARECGEHGDYLTYSLLPVTAADLEDLLSSLEWLFVDDDIQMMYLDEDAATRSDPRDWHEPFEADPRATAPAFLPLVH